MLDVTTCALRISAWSMLFFFKQKTAYEMRISDWSSDVCSSDLSPIVTRHWSWPGTGQLSPRRSAHPATVECSPTTLHEARYRCRVRVGRRQDRKSVESGKSVSVRVALGGRLHIKT